MDTKSNLWEQRTRLLLDFDSASCWVLFTKGDMGHAADEDRAASATAACRGFEFVGSPSWILRIASDLPIGMSFPWRLGYNKAR